MYSTWQLALKYVNWYLGASHPRGHGMHSPFVFDLITKVLNDKRDHPVYGEVEALRRDLEKDQDVLCIEDHGAGSALSRTKQRTVASLARHAAKPARFGQLLYRLINYYGYGQIVELGTSLGITSLYLSAGPPGSQLITVEGAPEVAVKAQSHFERCGRRNITLIADTFDRAIPLLLQKMPEVDLLFVDGNHRKEPTLQYFHQFLPHMREQGLMVFDDIHWSREMEEAWEIIRLHPAVTATVDLFFIGLVFFRPEFREKQHFRIRYR